MPTIFTSTLTPEREAWLAQNQCVLQQAADVPTDGSVGSHVNQTQNRYFCPEGVDVAQFPRAYGSQVQTPPSDQSRALGMTIYPAGMAIGAGVSAGLGYLLAGALGYGGKNGALVGGGLSLAYSLYTNKKSTGSFFPSRDPMGNGGGNGTSGCGCG